MRTVQTIFLAFFLLALAGGGAFWIYKQVQTERLEGPEAPPTSSLEELTEKITEEPEAEESESDPKIPEQEELPTNLNIEMPFYTQAPYSNWDYPWQEACEEASVLLVANLFNAMNLSREAYNTELLRLVDWEMETFGAYEHTTVAQTVEMIESQYGLQTLVHDDPSFEDLQEILNKGHLIIAPFAGKLLNNPNFLNGGPVYHMLVIKGYDREKAQVVTHDVGTRNGADYVYEWSVIESALHDWHDEDILLGTPRIIEVFP